MKTVVRQHRGFESLLLRLDVLVPEEDPSELGEMAESVEGARLLSEYRA